MSYQKILPCTLAVSLFSLSLPSHAEVSVTLTAASDYLFNGVSQTDEKPAIQGSIDWAGENGAYIGSWASNVDFGDGTDAEVDYYAGFSQSIDDNLWYDTGLAYYSYIGGDDSSEINYAEVYLTLGYQSTQITAWYSNDYAGTDAGHYIIALAHSVPLSETLSLNFQVDRSTSLDEDKFSWDTNDDSYIHYKAEAALSWQAFAFTLSLEKTDLNYDDDVKLLGTVSYTFGL